MTLPDYIPTRGAALVTDQEAAQLIGVSRHTIRKWRHKGWLPRFMNTPYTHTDDLYRCERDRRHAATIPLARLGQKNMPSET